MPFPSIRLLAAAALALSAAGSAQAFNNGSSSGTYSATIYYKHFLKISDNPPQWGFTTHQNAPTDSTYQGCVDQLNNYLGWLTAPAQNTSNSYYHVATVIPCRYIPGWGSVGEVLHGLSADVLSDFAHGERLLRQQYRIDQYEAELDRLYKRLQPAR